MFSLGKIAGKMALSAVFLLLFTGTVGAQAMSAETITLQVDLTLPTGMQITGTAVIERQAGTTRDNMSFVGTINGAYASLKATGTEEWSSPGEATFTVDKITQWESSKRQPPLPMTLHASMASAKLLTINGAPVAISGELKAPGSGSASYVVTAAGNGPQVVALLPNTGAGPAMISPSLLVMSLVASGLALIALGICLSQRHRRMQEVKLRVRREND